MMITVRPSRLEDARRLAELHVKSWQVAYRGILPQEFLDKQSVDDREGYRRSDMSGADPDKRCWTVELDGKPVGFAVTALTRDIELQPHFGEIHAIYLDPAAWGKGAGRELMSVALDDLKRRGFARVMLWVLRDNARGRRFYEAAGFAHDGAAKCKPWKGVDFHEVRYSIDLSIDKEAAMFDRFSHVMMYVKDVMRAVDWYKRNLGFAENFVSPHFASLRHDAMKTRIDLHPSEANSKDVGFGPIPYFAAKNFDKALAELKKRGVKTGEPRTEGGSPRFVSFWDSEGNALGLEETR